MSTATAGTVGPDGHSVLARALRRYWWLVLLATLVGGLLGQTLSERQPVAYTAEARLVLSKAAPYDPLGAYANPDASRFLANQLAVITSGPVLDGAVTRLPGTGVEELRASLEPTAGSDSDVISILATAPAAQTAQARADAVAAAYGDYRGQEIARQTEQALAQLPADDDTRRSTVAVQASQYGNGVAVAQPASLPEAPSRPQPRRDAFILAMVGAFLALAYALFLGGRPSRAERLRETARSLGVPILGSVPRLSPSSPAQWEAAARPGGRQRDAFAMLLVTLGYLDRGHLTGLMVTGARGLPTTTAAGLAIAATSQGARVVIVDAHGRTGRLAQLTGAATRTGLTGLVRKGSSLDDAAAAWSVTDGVVRVLAADLSSSDALTAAQAQAALATVGEDADLVIVDAPPLPLSPDAFAMVGGLDAVVLVTDWWTTPAEVEAATERLSYAGTRLAGLVETGLHQGVRPWDRARAAGVRQGPSEPTGSRAQPSSALRRDPASVTREADASVGTSDAPR